MQDMDESMDSNGEEWEIEQIPDGFWTTTNWAYKEPGPLVRLCLWKVTDLLMLKRHVHRSPSQDRCLPHSKSIETMNPLGLPHNLNEMIFKLLICESRPSVPKEVVLRPILMSCLENIEFSFDCSYSNMESLNDIIVRLTDYAYNIKVISIESINELAYHSLIYETKPWNDESVLNDIYKNFTKLLSNCINLRKLKINFLFDNRILSSLPNIVQLDLPFLNRDNVLYKYCSSLKIWDKINLIQNLPELRYLNYGDLGLSDFIENGEFKDLPLSRRFKIRTLKITKKATKKVLKLINRLFPDLKDISLQLDLYKLKELMKLEKYFTKYWLHISGSYCDDCIPFATYYGPLITVLRLNFNQITKSEFFYLISLVPNLGCFSVNSICICNWDFEPLAEDNQIMKSVARVLNRLKEFTLVCCTCEYDTYEIYEDFLIFLFSRCKNIEHLNVEYGALHDNIMHKILEKNYLRFLKSFECRVGVLSEDFLDALRLFVDTLEFIRLGYILHIPSYGVRLFY